MPYCISVRHDETSSGLPLAYGPYDDEDVALSDWREMGMPHYGVLPLRTPTAHSNLTGDLEHPPSEETPMRFAVHLRSAREGGYWSEVSGLPGAGSQGETIEETVRNTRDSIAAVVATLLERGESIPHLRGDDRFVTLKIRV